METAKLLEEEKGKLQNTIEHNRKFCTNLSKNQLDVSQPGMSLMIAMMRPQCEDLPKKESKLEERLKAMELTHMESKMAKLEEQLEALNNTAPSRQ